MILIFREKQIGEQNKQANYKLNYKKTAPKNIIIAFGCCRMTGESIFIPTITSSLFFQRLINILTEIKQKFKEENISQFASAIKLCFEISLRLVF